MYQTISHPWDDDFDFAAFRRQIEDFSYLLFDAHLRSPEAFKAEAVSHLARLYASGTQMPPYSPFASEELAVDRTESPKDLAEETGARRNRLSRLTYTLKASLGDDDAYIAVDWPGEEQLITLSLSHELAEIHEELMSGAREWDQGDRDDAASTWVYGFDEGHWGSGALSVLTCLHRIVGERMSLLLGPAASRLEPPGGDVTEGY